MRRRRESLRKNGLSIPSARRWTRGKLIPGADVISTFSADHKTALVKSQTNGPSKPDLTNVPKAPYAGCMSCPLQNDEDAATRNVRARFIGAFFSWPMPTRSAISGTTSCGPHPTIRCWTRFREGAFPPLRHAMIGQAAEHRAASRYSQHAEGGAAGPGYSAAARVGVWAAASTAAASFS